MQIKITFKSSYAQAQQHIIDVARQLARNPGDDVVMQLEGELGRYWCGECNLPLEICPHGNAVLPEPPVVENDDPDLPLDIPPGAVPFVAGAVEDGEDD